MCLTRSFSLLAGEVKNPDHFLYAEETKLAWEAGKLSADITEEQRKLNEADLIIFQVVLWVAAINAKSQRETKLKLYSSVPHVLV